MAAESSGNPNAVSPKGAQGLFQFLPQTAKAYGINPLDPQQAAVGAARMYGDLSKQFGGDVPSMLAAYNWGSGNLAKKGMQNAPLETRNYIDRVQQGMGKSNKQYAQADTGNVSDGMPALPEGFVLKTDLPNLPEGFVLNGDNEQTSEKGYMQRVGEDIVDAANKGASIITEGTRNPLSAAIQAGGQAANMVASPIAEVGVSAYKSLPDDWQKNLSSTAKKVANKVGDTTHGIADYLDATEAGRAFGDFGANNPSVSGNLQEVADTAKAVGNIGLTLSPTSATKNLSIAKTASNITKKIGNAISSSGQASADAAKYKLASDLYTPKLTQKVLEERAANTSSSGVNQTPTYVPPAHEVATINVLQDLPIKASNTLQKNYNIVKDAVRETAQSLTKTLDNTPVKYKPDFFNNQLDASLNSLKTDPLIIGDGEKVADRVFNKMKEISAKNPSTPSGLLKSRQEFDAWARSKKGSVFDANDTAFSSSVKNARNTANKFISDIAPNADVKASLLKQSQLLDAMDNIQTKIPSAPRTRIGMVTEKAGKLVPDSGAGKLAGLSALGALGATAPVASAAMALGAGGIYAGYKAATSPILRKTLGKTLEKSSGLSEPVIALSPLAAFGDKFDRKVTNKPLKITIHPDSDLPKVNLPTME